MSSLFRRVHNENIRERKSKDQEDGTGISPWNIKSNMLVNAIHGISNEKSKSNEQPKINDAAHPEINEENL